MTRDDKGRFVKGISGNPNGRASKEREVQYRDILVSTITIDRWKKIIVKAAEQAERGDSVARKWLADYLIGVPVQKTELGGADGSALEIIVRYAENINDTEAA